MIRAFLRLNLFMGLVNIGFILRNDTHSTMGGIILIYSVIMIMLGSIFGWKD